MSSATAQICYWANFIRQFQCCKLAKTRILTQLTQEGLADKHYDGTLCWPDSENEID